MPERFNASPLAGGMLASKASELVVAEWTDAGGGYNPPRYIAPLHVHHGDDEAWYVLEGALCIRLGDREVQATPGCGVLVPRGTPHTYWNPYPTQTRYLIVMTRRIRRLVDALHTLEDQSRMAKTYEQFESEYLGFP